MRSPWLPLLALAACGAATSTPPASMPAPLDASGLWDRHYINQESVPRRESFMFMDGGRFAWIASALADDVTTPSMAGEGFLRWGTWLPAGRSVVVTELHRALDSGAHEPVAPPVVRHLLVEPCSADDLAATGAPKGTPCLVIGGAPFVRAGDAARAAAEVETMIKPSEWLAQ